MPGPLDDFTNPEDLADAIRTAEETVVPFARKMNQMCARPDRPGTSRISIASWIVITEAGARLGVPKGFLVAIVDAIYRLHPGSDEGGGEEIDPGWYAHRGDRLVGTTPPLMMATAAWTAKINAKPPER